MQKQPVAQQTAAGRRDECQDRDADDVVPAPRADERATDAPQKCCGVVEERR
ncbi:MAG TPA: hypothetical protein VGM05_04180 [Planctomycetaceae bacterium]|jgi:hypothetical protein